MKQDPYIIQAVLGNAILSKGGQLTLVYRMHEPECFSLHATDFELRNVKIAQALGNLPEKSWVHKQDVFLRRQYHSELSGTSFIDQAESCHFEGREYYEHQCILAFGISDLNSLDAAYNANPFDYRSKLHKEDGEKLSIFLSAVENAATVINSIDRDTRLVQLTGEEIKTYIDESVNLFTANTGNILSVNYGDKLQAGEQKGEYFALYKDSFFPMGSTVSTHIPDDTLPDSGGHLYMSLFEELGIHLQANHIYNQIFYFEGHQKLQTKMDDNRRLHGALRKFDPNLERKAIEMEALMKQIMQDKSVLCLCHLNVFVWDNDEDRLSRACKQIRDVFARRNYRYLMPSKSLLAHIHLGSIVGQESGMLVPGNPHRFFFILPTPTALCFWIHYSGFRDAEEGILCNDRKFQRPLRVDIWDAKRKFMNARNAMVIASTGGGKSSTALNIVQQLIEQDYVVVIVEFGNSFKNLCKLYPDRSLHIEYDGNSPLGINPFDLEGREMDNEKIESLSNIVQRYWRHILNKVGDAEQKTCLDLLIKDYYEQGKRDYSFVDFYHHVIENFEEICKRHEEVNMRKYFDVDSFKSICSEFLPGRRYESVVSTEQLQPLSGKNLIVFELSQIKGNAFLSSLVMNILFDVINTKILSDKSKRGYLIFDEYAEAAKMRDKTADTSIHGTVAYCYQTIRKTNGAVMTIVQTPSQLPHGNEPGAADTENIIANTQLLIVLPTNEVVYDSVIENFKIRNEAHIALMKSISNNFAGKRPYSEMFLRMQEKRALVVRNEFSREKYLAFQTDGETNTALDRLEEQLGSRQKAIEAYIQQENQAKTNQI